MTIDRQGTQSPSELDIGNVHAKYRQAVKYAHPEMFPKTSTGEYSVHEKIVNNVRIDAAFCKTKLEEQSRLLNAWMTAIKSTSTIVPPPAEFKVKSFTFMRWTTRASGEAEVSLCSIDFTTGESSAVYLQRVFNFLIDGTIPEQVPTAAMRSSSERRDAGREKADAHWSDSLSGSWQETIKVMSKHVREWERYLKTSIQVHIDFDSVSERDALRALATFSQFLTTLSKRVNASQFFPRKLTICIYPTKPKKPFERGPEGEVIANMTAATSDLELYNNSIGYIL